MSTLRYLAAIVALVCSLPGPSFSAAAAPAGSVPEIDALAPIDGARRHPGVPAASLTMQVTPLTQYRHVRARAFVDCMGYPPVEDVQDITAPDFTPFVAMADATAEDPGGYCDAYAEASQNSEIQAARLVGSGGASAYSGNGTNHQYGVAMGQSISEYDVTFELDQELPYTLSGSIARSFISGTASVALRDEAGGYIHNFVFSAPEPLVIDFNVVGTLLAGRYRLTASGSISPSPGLANQFGNYQFDLLFGQATAVEPSTWGRIKAQMR